MALPFLLLAAQAAGFAYDIHNSRKSLKMQQAGQRLDEAQVNLRMNQERLQFEEQSLGALENLREVMASQRALFAAQGRVPGIGSTAAIERKSMKAFETDERARRLSQGFREHYLKSQVALSRIGIAGQKAQLGASNFQKGFQMIPFSGFLGNKGGNQFKSPLEGLYNNG